MKHLKIVAIFTFTLAMATSVAAQNWNWGGIRGEGPVVKETLDVDDFNAVTLAFSGNVYLQQGNTQSVVVEAQKNIIENIETEVRNGHWKIKFDKSVRKHDRVKIFITVPTLTEANISGSGDIDSEGKFTGLGDFKSRISGSGDINMDIEAKDVTSTISGSGGIKLSGSADAIDIQISGSGDVYAEDLQVVDCRVKISGSGDSRVHATGSLEVRVSGSGDVRYKGGPKVTAKVSGSGDVEAW
jgi:hypothetical protein